MKMKISSLISENLGQNETPGCLSGILCRLPCSKEISPVESDLPKNSNTTVEMIKTSTTPGIVARLMGLDSFPAESNFMPTVRTPDLINRSRSVNSVNFWSEFDPTLQRTMHQKVKTTSFCFPEISTFLRSGNNEFLHLNCINEGQSEKLRSKSKKSEMGIENMKQRKTEKCENKNRGERILGKKPKEELAQDQYCNLNEIEEQRKRISDRPSQRFLNCRELIKDLGLIPKNKTEGLTRTSTASTEKIQLKPGDPNEEGSDGSNKLVAARKKKNRSLIKKVEPKCMSDYFSPDSVLDPYSVSLSEPETLLPGNGGPITRNIFAQFDTLGFTSAELV